MQIGAMNDPYRQLFDEIDWFAANGFDYIDLTVEAPGAAPESTDWRAVAAAIQGAGLGVVCHTAPYLPIHNPSPLVRQAAVDELRRSIDVAQIVGAKLCTMHFMGWPPYLSEAQGYEFYRQMLEILVRHGGEQGVAVAMENRQYRKSCYEAKRSPEVERSARDRDSQEYDSNFCATAKIARIIATSTNTFGRFSSGCPI